MSWQGIAGQDEVVDRFRRSVGRGRVASSYLLVGPPGVGKRLFAEKLGQALLCPSCDPSGLSPCGTCRSCQLMQSGNHPDWDYICLPEGKKTIPVELFIGDRQHRGREGFCHRLAMKPFLGGRRIGVIDDADHLSEEDANCLLKTLEEPPLGSVLMLLGTSPDRQLPTIRSRCQLMRFRPLSDQALAELLLAAGKVEDRSAAERLARCSGGSLERAAQLSDPDVWQFREDFLARMAQRPLDTIRLAKAIAAFYDAAGKEAAIKRQRMALVIEWAIELLSGLLRMSAGDLNAGDLADDTLRSAATALAGQQHLNTEAIIAAIDRCYAALDHVQRNAHLAIVTECWLDDLAQLAADN
jgi:DNA polymerase-3 subunit delta'